MVKIELLENSGPRNGKPELDTANSVPLYPNYYQLQHPHRVALKLQYPVIHCPPIETSANWMVIDGLGVAGVQDGV